MRSVRRFDPDSVSSADLPALERDTHDRGLSNETFRRFDGDLLQHSGPKCFDLMAGIAQTGHLEPRMLADPQNRVWSQRQKIDSASGEILIKVTGEDFEAFCDNSSCSK